MTAFDWHQKADEYVKWCAETGTPPRADEFARLHGLSPWTLSRRFSAATGDYVGSYLRHQRIKIVADLVRTTNDPLDVIRERTGFYCRSSFFRAFKEAFGVAPGRFGRRNNQEIDDEWRSIRARRLSAGRHQSVAFLPGDDYSELTNRGRNLLSSYPSLRSSLRTDRENPGITFVEV